MRRHAWSDWPEERLLDLRICDLGVRVEESPVWPSVQRVRGELAARDLRFHPHFWLSEDWFSPDPVPGVAVPFYLAHPRLTQLERKQQGRVEGGSRRECLQILRHEVGHALDHAYVLHRRRSWQEHFGKSSKPYPSYYRPKPYSRDYVQHLDFWYAQSHPDEDFAETFAVWLAPRSGWRRRYADWPALGKLDYVDGLMQEIAGKRPITHSRRAVEPLSALRKTLREYYAEKRARYERELPGCHDAHLLRLFRRAEEGAGHEQAAAFLRRNRAEIQRLVSRWTREYQYTLNHVLREMIGRCRALKLYAVGSARQLRTDFAILLLVQAMNRLRAGRERVGM